MSFQLVLFLRLKPIELATTMAILNFPTIRLFYSFRFEIINSIALSLLVLSTIPMVSMAEIDNKLSQKNQTIEGQSGGFVDSQGCGFIADRPNYEMNLSHRVDYIRLTVQADGGQPTLLVLGPNSEDSFCVLGDEISGLKPEISGVWEPGNYEIYVGDRSGKQHQFILDISTDN